MTKRLPATVLILCSSIGVGSPAVADPMHQLNIDLEQMTVSGVSAGGQMAHQMHIAYSDLFNGAGIIAGGPYACADGSLATAMARCVGTADPAFPVEKQAAMIRSAADAGQVAAVEGLADDPVWLFHGAMDTTVAAGVSDLLAELYELLLPADQIEYIKDIEAGHNFPALNSGSECTAMEAPYVGDCDYDAAGELLQHLYPDLRPPSSEVQTELVTVDLPGAAAAGLSDTAYLFIPPACADGETSCALHLVFHGCAQSAVQVDTGFMLQSGYLPWAEANDIVVAFPQVVPGALNPLACWDWWGYSGTEYLYRDGKQMKLLAEWIKQL